MQNGDFRRATLCFADLGNTNLQDANLGFANLKSAVLVGANLREAILRKAYMDNVQTQEINVFVEQLEKTATLYGLEFKPDSDMERKFEQLIEKNRKLKLKFKEDMEAVWIHLAQISLKEEGLYYGDVDRIAGPITKRALIQFQKDYGIEPTGVIDTKTRIMMRMSDRTEQIPGCIKSPQTAGGNCEFEMPRSVLRGLRRLDMNIQSVKLELGRLGYYTREINDKYDLEFIEAVQRFQAAMNIDADGLLGEGTARTFLAVLRGDRKPDI
jgi:murein L,D-transpeptidase YcbB/YkuD